MATTKKTVLITGSTRGIGHSLAEHYTQTGWNVIGTARANSNTDKIVILDTSDGDSVLEAGRQLEGVPIDLLINNAGIAQAMTFATATKASLMQQFEVNVTGHSSHGNTVVLQVSSIVGSIATNKEENALMFKGHYGYTASKAALNMVTHSLVLDLREKNVVVIVANPGFVDTEMNNHHGHVKPADSAASLAGVAANATIEDSSIFFDADPTTPGSELPW